MKDLKPDTDIRYSIRNPLIDDKEMQSILLLLTAVEIAFSDLNMTCKQRVWKYLEERVLSDFDSEFQNVP